MVDKFCDPFWIHQNSNKHTLKRIAAFKCAYIKAQKAQFFLRDAYLHLLMLLSSAYLNRKQPAWYLQYRSTAKIVREKLNVDGG